MEDQIFSLDDLAKLKEQEEEEKSKLPYAKYLKNFKTLVQEHNSKIINAIINPRTNDQREYVCIKEPLEFIQLFQSCTGQDECIALFDKLLEARDKRVIDQVIYENNQNAGFWFNTTKNGINLRPGLKDEEWSSPLGVTLGDDVVHSLVAGRTGSGKSVFLNNIIFSLIAEYSPWEIDLYLVDFKKVEFSRYLSKYNVPHIKAVAATSEIRYVLSLLLYLSKCMKARQDFFALIGMQKLSDVREKYNIVLPRVLLIVDEFQQLFLESTNKEQMLIEELLTSITKLGRATGFHLIFASQEMSGTMNANVFGNFKARFALACEPEVSSRVLGNAAASKIEKKGIVISNTGSENAYFKVPFISDDYFYEYLGEITDLADKYKFASVHKFYQEESIKDICELEKVLLSIKDTRNKYIESNSSLVDIFTLGEAVVFNYKKYDYETVFVERGVRKNVGVFSPNVDDTAYVCKLLATNFNYSPKCNKYNHFVLARNDLFMKKYDLATDLKIPSDRVFSSIDFLAELIGVFNRRRREAALLNSFYQYSNLREFAYNAFCLRAEHMISDLSETEREVLYELSSYFEDKQVSDIPQVKKAILEDFDFDNSYFRVIDMLFEKEINKKTLAELFDAYVVWLIGAEMVGKFPKEMEAVLTDATNYNMLFIIVASNNDFNDFYMIQKTCDYIFVSGNNETYYNKLKIPFTKKSENSIAIDFAISSSATQRSFKKFKYELEELVVPSIDFDEILG